MGSFAAPGIEGFRPAGEVPTHLRIASEGESDAWRAMTSSLVAEAAEGPPRFVVTRLERLGLLMDHEVLGQFLIGEGGEQVVCAPGQHIAWRWQRCLVGQVLPLVALLRGKEVLHASAVEIGGAAALFMGPSGAGKTSAALGLVGAGAGFVADDVAALEVSDGVVVVHPGAGLASATTADLGYMGGALRDGRASTLGEWEGETRIALTPVRDSVPVGALCVLSPTVSGDAIRIEPIATSPVVTLLGATFNSFVANPDRLRRQLDVISRLLETTRLVRVVAPRALGHEALRQALASYLNQAVP